MIRRIRQLQAEVRVLLLDRQELLSLREQLKERTHD